MLFHIVTSEDLVHQKEDGTVHSGCVQVQLTLGFDILWLLLTCVDYTVSGKVITARLW